MKTLGIIDGRTEIRMEMHQSESGTVILALSLFGFKPFGPWMLFPAVQPMVLVDYVEQHRAMVRWMPNLFVCDTALCS